MLKLLIKLFPWARIKVLEQENSELREKLAERQQAINKTNAYWKKRFNDLVRKNRSEHL